MDNLSEKITELIKEEFKDLDFVPLHAPVFFGNEKKYLADCIDSTFVSSVGQYVTKFEEEVAKYTSSKYAVAMVNGTNALHLALLASGLHEGDEVITQALSFVATANAISYAAAIPIFIDVDKDTLGMSPDALSNFLEKNAQKEESGETINKTTGRKIHAVVPMHTLGFPCDIVNIKKICEDWNIELIEDAAESLGSFYKNQHTGTFGKMGVFSLNGNKTITSGGGGFLITNDESIAKKVKHLSTQAKVPHPYEYFHDEIGYNYRMPNLNAALALAQLEQLEKFIASKRELASRYTSKLRALGLKYITEKEDVRANYWLGAIQFENIESRNSFLKYSNANGIMTRPIWQLLNTLPMFENCQSDELSNSNWLYERIVNIPSSVRL